MASVGYDFDNSGLMPKIQALIAPPVAEKTNNRYKGRKRMKKSGDITSKGSGISKGQANSKSTNGGTKWSNHEFCDFCREGGDVLCCDRCPATFHLQCNEPPLEEDEIPEGEYFCKRCRVLEEMNRNSAIVEGPGNGDEVPFTTTEKRRRPLNGNLDNEKAIANGSTINALIDQDSKSCDSVGSIIESPQDVPTVVEDSGNHNEDTSDEKNDCEEDVVDMQLSDQREEADKEETKKSNPLYMLIRAASVVNPKQFQLPADYVSSVPLPGTSKKVPNISSVNFKAKKLPHELDNGLVPFPLKLCFVCNKSCRKAALLQCDFCSLLFHADCLDPPLTAFPTTRWMCPNHAEHVIDQKLLKTDRLSEKIKLWNTFSGRINQDGIKLDFLQKAKNAKNDDGPNDEGFAQIRVEVPNAIKNMYKYPTELLNRSSYPAIETSDPAVSMESKRQQFKDQCVAPPSTEEQEAWLSGVVHLQSSIAEFLVTNKHKNIVKSENFGGMSKSDIRQSVSNWMDSKDYAWKTVEGNDRAVKKEHVSDLNDTVTKIKLDCDPIAQDAINSRAKVEDLIKQSPTSTAEVNLLKHLDEKLIRALALQRLQQILPSSPNANECDATKKSANNFSTFATCNTMTVKRLCVSEIRARATLCPVSAKNVEDAIRQVVRKASQQMVYRSLTIGLSGDNDVVLSSYDSCNFISAKHATIFYDEDSCRYELINYSEHGTYVDNVLYCPDFTERFTKAAKMASPRKAPGRPLATRRKGAKRKTRFTKISRKAATNKKAVSVVTSPVKATAIKSLASTSGAVKRKSALKIASETKARSYEETASSQPVMCASVKGDLKLCACRSSSSAFMGSSSGGWEGAAPLNHGSHIRIGCIQFVFSITNHAKPETLRKAEHKEEQGPSVGELTCPSNTSTISVMSAAEEAPVTA